MRHKHKRLLGLQFCECGAFMGIPRKFMSLAELTQGPIRVQRKRTKGWKMPPNTIYVGRPSPWGNPYDWQEYGRAHAVDLFSYNMDENFKQTVWLALRGKNLACWCPLNQPCHANILLEIANGT